MTPYTNKLSKSSQGHIYELIWLVHAHRKTWTMSQNVLVFFRGMTLGKCVHLSDLCSELYFLPVQRCPTPVQQPRWVCPCVASLSSSIAAATTTGHQPPSRSQFGDRIEVTFLIQPSQGLVGWLSLLQIVLNLLLQQSMYRTPHSSFPPPMVSYHMAGSIIK